MVSVIIPTYNRGYCLHKAVTSVLEQTYKDLEVIIIDDGSTDETPSVISSFKDSRVSFIRLDDNKGVSYARNIGMKMSKGEFIAFQDSDDYWHPEKLEEQMVCMKNNNADFCYTYIRHMLPNNESVLVPDENEPLEQKNGHIYGRLLVENMIGAPTLLMKRECFCEIGGFDEKMPALEDWDYVLRLSKKYLACFVPKPLFDATYSEKSISRNIVHRIMATCMIIGRYKQDMINYNVFDYHVNQIVAESQEIGMEEDIVNFLKKCITLL